MRTVVMFVNPDKPDACAVKQKLESMLNSANIHTVCATTGKGNTLDQQITDVLQHAELVCVLGGDGTLLGVARQLAQFDVPLLGINVGHLGFLTEADPGDLETVVRRIVERDYLLERRMMLEAAVYRDGRLLEKVTGLNDAGIAKGSFARMVTVDVSVDDVYVDSFSGDGILISTPTGSTAYSLSCGGPIVTPHLQVMLLTPICPHTLFSRPCVIDATQTIRIVVHATHDDLGLTVDGQIGVRLAPNDVVAIQKSRTDTVLVKWKDHEFFDVLRNKLHNSGTSPTA